MSNYGFAIQFNSFIYESFTHSFIHLFVHIYGVGVICVWLVWGVDDKHVNKWWEWDSSYHQGTYIWCKDKYIYILQLICLSSQNIIWKVIQVGVSKKLCVLSRKGKHIFWDRLRTEVMEKVIFKMVPKDDLEFPWEIWEQSAVTDRMIWGEKAWGKFWKQQSL